MYVCMYVCVQVCVCVYGHLYGCALLQWLCQNATVDLFSRRQRLPLVAFFSAIQTMIHFVSNGPAQPMDCPLLNETLLPVLIVTRMITAKILLAATPGD